MFNHLVLWGTPLFLCVGGNSVRLPVSDNVVDHHGYKTTALFIELYSKNRSGIGIHIFV